MDVGTLTLRVSFRHTRMRLATLDAQWALNCQSLDVLWFGNVDAEALVNTLQSLVFNTSLEQLTALPLNDAAKSWTSEMRCLIVSCLLRATPFRVVNQSD
jgi:hypothetical protein